VETDTKCDYPCKEARDALIVRNKSRENFYPVKFAIFEYVERGELDLQDVGTVCALSYFVAFGSGKGDEKHAASRERLLQMMNVDRGRFDRSIKRLVDCGIVSRELQMYKPTIYSLEDVADWKGQAQWPQNAATVPAGSDASSGRKMQPLRGSKMQPQKRLQNGAAKDSIASSENFESKKTSAPAESAGAPQPSPALEKRKAAATKSKPEKTTDPRVSLGIMKFDECYRAARSGQPYAVDGWRDGKAIKSLSPAYTIEILCGMIEAYFADDSSFWATKGRSIAFFVRWLNDEASAEAFARIQAGGSAVLVEDDEFALADRRVAAEQEKWRRERGGVK
jgi:hypothetical protein